MSDKEPQKKEDAATPLRDDKDKDETTRPAPKPPKKPGPSIDIGPGPGADVVATPPRRI